MKNLLILATPRSGSGALYQAISSNYFEYHSYYEPWSKWNPVTIQGEHIVKSLVNHKDNWEQTINNYDKVIYISRKDKEAGFQSYKQAQQSRNFVDKYQKDLSVPEVKGIRDFYFNTFDRLEATATDKIWYYEDLFYNRIEIDKLIRHHNLKIRHPDRFYNFFKTGYKYGY